MLRFWGVIALLVLGMVSCGGNVVHRDADSGEELMVVERVDYDSLYKAMDERYNQLCAERVVAFTERDSARRAYLIEANDRACRVFSDSLQRIMAMQDRL